MCGVLSVGCKNGNLVASPLVGDGRQTSVGGKPRRYLRHFAFVSPVANRQSLPFYDLSCNDNYETE